MDARSESQEFVALKLALQVYAQARAALPPGERRPTAQELGELLLKVVAVAEQLHVDLVRAAQDRISERGANLPRLVHPPLPIDEKPR